MLKSTIEVDVKRFEKLVEMERKQKLSARRASIKNQLMIEKAKEAKITVTKSEIDARMAEEDAKKAPEDTPPSTEDAEVTSASEEV